MHFIINSNDVSTLTNTDDTLTNMGFSGKMIRKVFMDKKAYVNGADFSQNDTDLTLFTDAWVDGKVIIAEE